jgi:hypothetical protein
MIKAKGITIRNLEQNRDSEEAITTLKITPEERRKMNGELFLSNPPGHTYPIKTGI